MKVTVSGWLAPAVKTVPAAGEYVKTPGTEAVASSWAAPRMVPAMMSAGWGQAIVGVACATLIIAVALALV